MAIRRNVYIQNVVPQVRQASRQLKKFDRTRNPSTIGEALAALNEVVNKLSEAMLPKDKEDVVGNECDCEEGEVCECDNDEYPRQKVPDEKEIVRGMRQHRNNAGVEAELERQHRGNRHVTNAHRAETREMDHIRNSLGRRSSLLSEEELAEIAARNARNRKQR